MNNIPLFKVYMSPEAVKASAEVLQSGYIGQGSKVEEFENSLKVYLKNDRVLTVNSATSAEHLALLLLKKPAVFNNVIDGAGYSMNNWPGLEPGDEVLSTPLTCTASNFPTILAGYKLKWVDVDPINLNMDLDDLARKITPKTKIIMLVFWGGMPVDMQRLKKIQDTAYNMYGFKPAIIIDGAHSLGATYQDTPINNFGHITTYSFQAIKHITSVDGGALILPHAELYKRGKLLRWYGIDREGDRKDFRCESNIDEVGTKWHMNDVNAVIGDMNLKYGRHVLEAHINNAAHYNKTLANIPGVTLLTPTPHAKSAYWIYTIKVENRDGFMQKMAENNITVSRVHERNDKHTAVREFLTQLPTLDTVSAQMICIPVGWWVTEEQREHIVKTIKSGW